MSRVYVGRLPPRCSERDIERFFKGYGRLRDVVLKAGYGFVEFENSRDADDAVYDLHGRDLHGERIIVEHARLPPGSRGNSNRRRESVRRYGPPTRTEYRVVVENLSSRVSWQDLKDMMRKAGEVTYADAHKQARNEGIVEFASYNDMKAAVDKYDGYTLYERRLKVYEDKPRRRSRSRSRRGSRRSRSRGSRGRRDRSRSDSRNRDRSASNRSRDRSAASERSRSPQRSDRSVSHRSNGHLSRSPSKNGNGSMHGRSRSASRERSNSRQRSRSQSRGRSASGSRGNRSRSGSHKSPADRSRSHSRSRSRSASPRHNDGNGISNGSDHANGDDN